MQVNFNLRTIVKWGAFLALAIFIGYTLGWLTFKSTMVMLVTLYVGSRV